MKMKTTAIDDNVDEYYQNYNDKNNYGVDELIEKYNKMNNRRMNKLE